MIRMQNIRRAVTRTAAGTLVVLGAAACSNDFLNVTNPDVIDAATVDPTSGASTLAQSAQQNFATALGLLSVYSGWFTVEANVSDTFPTRNEFGFRLISDLNGSLNTDVWTPLSRAAASTKTVLDLDLPNPDSNLNVARAATFRGFSILMMATDFCTGTLSGGPELTTAQLLDSAIFWFDRAVSVGTNAGTEGRDLANASRVGRARAKLQKGDKAGAAADAAAVPAGFVYNMRYTDDAGNRARLSNRQYQLTFDRSSISVAPFFRTGDPRVPFKAPTGPDSTKLSGQDAVPGGFYEQTKFNGYATPQRLASKLEADYIAAEAGTTAQQLALIAAQRAANNQPAYSGPTDAASVLKELYLQRSFEFYLEGRRLGDYRRSPASVSGITAPGDPYFKPGYANTGDQTCYPLPRVERDNNPNMS